MRNLAALLGLILTTVLLIGGCPRDLTAGNSATTADGTATTDDASGTQTTSADLSSQYPSCLAVSDPEAMKAAVLQLVNQERTARGLGALTYSDVLEQPAMEHACEMIQYNFFSHDNPVTGSTSGERIAASGFQATCWGENIAAGQTTANQVVDGWMNSPGHRANILHPDFTHLGVGVRRGGTYGIYWVQVFAGT